MKKVLAAAILGFVGLAGCGGDAEPARTELTISMYGEPVVSNSPGNAVPTPSDTQATIQALQGALAAQGVNAAVTPQVMNGTSLHTLVTVGDNGHPPTADQFKTDPSSYVLVNFRLDDMVTPWTDPAQQAAAEQFQRDLEVFIQRMQTAGKQVWLVTPIATCDYPRGSSSYSVRYRNYTAVDALTSAISQAVGKTGGHEVGALTYQYAWVYDSTAQLYGWVNTVTQGHMGADCRTPDAYLQNMRIQLIAGTIAAFSRGAGVSNPASHASAPTAPSVASAPH
ncbi:hypothetical protein [Burkholderia sp. LMG 32019]|uniref:hypothetical protein n=1 Tax=Burkholderia sp. LMG 32019 TaxID=3158173 RepID=UPI003C2BBFCC